MHDYSLHPSRRMGVRRANPRAYVFLFSILAVLVALFVFRGKKPAPASQASIPGEVPTSVNAPKIQTQAELVSAIETVIRSTTGTYSVFIVPLTGGQPIGINEETIYTAASVNKVPIVAALYNLAGKGDVDLEKIIVPQPSDIQDYGTGSIRYGKPGTPYSIKTLARLMMEQSDNTAAYILANHVVGMEPLQSFVTELGMNQTDMKENKSSTKDMSILFLKMHKGEITSEALTQEMMGFMDKTDFEDRIPTGIPEGIKVYHKTGDEVNKIHDAGIVDLPGNPYYLGIFTTDQTDEAKTKETIAKISSLVYSYMRK